MGAREPVPVATKSDGNCAALRRFVGFSVAGNSVSAVAADGSESPVAYPGNADSFISNPPFPAAQPRP